MSKEFITKVNMTRPQQEENTGVFVDLLIDGNFKLIMTEPDNGRRAVIKVQYNSRADYLDRVLYYSTWPVYYQKRSGENNYSLDEVYVISFCNFELERFRKEEGRRNSDFVRTCFEMVHKICNGSKSRHCLFSFILPLFSLVFWNLENHFDYFDEGKSDSDTEFSSRGDRHWTKKRFEAKNAMIGKTLLWSGSVSGSAAESALCPPAIIGIAEVESAFVLKRLCSSGILRKTGYRYVHFESRDQRGIDVGLMYLPDSMQLVEAVAVPIVSGRDTLATRDILYAFFKNANNGENWHFFVNHHPSKYGGKASEPRRVAAMQTLVGLMDSLYAAGERNIVAMGDFNDTPDGEAFGLVSETDWAVNLGRELLRCSGGKAVGTIRYQGNWELIDNFIVSRDVAGKMQMQILRPPFLMERDRSYPGEKPRRTYIGPRYNGGVSDHLPIMLFPQRAESLLLKPPKGGFCG